MVAIDAAWKDDSNGCQFVKFDDLDLGYEILAVKPVWAELDGI